MRRTPGFKTRPSAYSITLAPTNRARCRLCKRGIEKGTVRIVTHAFVMPGRAHHLACHAECATPALAGAMLKAYGTVRRVPMADVIGLDEREGVCAQLESVMK